MGSRWFRTHVTCNDINTEKLSTYMEKEINLESDISFLCNRKEIKRKKRKSILSVLVVCNVYEEKQEKEKVL